MQTHPNWGNWVSVKSSAINTLKRNSFSKLPECSHHVVKAMEMKEKNLKRRAREWKTARKS